MRTVRKAEDFWGRWKSKRSGAKRSDNKLERDTKALHNDEEEVDHVDVASVQRFLEAKIQRSEENPSAKLVTVPPNHGSHDSEPRRTQSMKQSRARQRTTVVASTEHLSESHSIKSDFGGGGRQAENAAPDRQKIARPHSVYDLEHDTLKQSPAKSQSLPFREVKALLESEKATWYLPNASRDETDRKLSESLSGTFFVRKSVSKQGCWAFSMKRDDSGVWNGLIREVDQGFMVKGVDILYTSLTVLIARIITEPKLRSMLGIPRSPRVPMKKSKSDWSSMETAIMMLDDGEYDDALA